ncbi:MAG: arsenate reductase (glutaredoxin) [Campylobacterota bacterium]|nr:arsenate reductase (glutaredoxin) [Campylobacterota bacterium]
MNSVTIWHNPRCSKSREAVAIAEENNCDKEIVKYLETQPNAATIKNLLKMLGVSARELMRTKEAIYKELDLKNESDEEKLVEAMAANPKLIERPVLIKNNKAIIGRPSSVIAEFLNA